MAPRHGRVQKGLVDGKALVSRLGGEVLDNPHLAQGFMNSPAAPPASRRNEQGTGPNVKAASIDFRDGRRSSKDLANLVVTLTCAGERTRRNLPDSGPNTIPIPYPQGHLSLPGRGAGRFGTVLSWICRCCVIQYCRLDHSHSFFWAALPVKIGAKHRWRGNIRLLSLNKDLVGIITNSVGLV